ncbi:hypothetical protein [Allomesorhizobium camelthorni]|uniref:Uncharacterized protein n=1 Tax=Allomesorhizobium camelthorni TaxID=475069 RepID=A0A6G4WK85_9HYPH|nr:hypothetical protein [Mesorhizobium camelthorni]NGO55019.1 hypothetical protein [Mesorhizobium camelthorni]
MTRNQFRFLTLLCFASSIAAGVWDFFVPFPTELNTFILLEETPIDRLGTPGLIVLSIALLAVTALSFALLLIFHRWAPSLFVGLNALLLAISPFFGYGIYSPGSEQFAMLSTFLAGAMIPIMFMTNVRTFFGKQAGNAT